MIGDEQASRFKDAVLKAESIVIVQADNPDSDSLGSALALEAILQEQGKQTYLYCAVDMPDYLKFFEGWSRVSKELPHEFGLSIIVDASTRTLFEKAEEIGLLKSLAPKPCLVLDHHRETTNDLDFATLIINNPDVSSTSELIYAICKQQGWKVPLDAARHIMSGILGDTQGLANQLTSPRTYRIMADLTEAGVDRPALEEARRAFTKMPQEIFRFKADLIRRAEFVADGRLALVSVSQDDINKYSPLYNPGPLIQNDLLQVESVLISIVFKIYANGTVTAMIRANNGAGVADKLAVHFGGGGHAFASGFKVVDASSFEKVKAECIQKTTELLNSYA